MADARAERLARAAWGVLALALALVLTWAALRDVRVGAELAAARAALPWARLERALENLERARALAPGNAAVHGEIGRVQVMRARWRDDPEAAPQAVAAFETAIALNPLDAEHRAEFGWALLRLARPLEALVAFEQALARDPFNAYYLASLGRAHEDAGDTTAALDAYRRAQAVLPTHEVRARIAALGGD